MGKFLEGATGTGNSFAAQSAPITQQNFAGDLANSQNQYNQAQGNQTTLAQALQNQANGFGPNIAQQQLQAATDQGIKQNAGMIASAKGISPALAQREAAQNQASMSQQAAGQAANLQANQSLAAQNSLAGVYQNQAGEATSMNSNLQNAQAAQNNAIVGNTSQMNSANGAVAGQNAAQAGNLFGQAAGGVAGAVSSFLNEGGVVPSQHAQLAEAMKRMGAQHFAAGGQVMGAPAQYTQYGQVSAVPMTSPAQPNAFSTGQTLGTAIQNLFGGSGPSDDQQMQQYMDADQALGMGGVDNKVVKAPAANEFMNTEMAFKGGMIGKVPMHIAEIYHPGKYAQGGAVLDKSGGKVPGKANIPGKNSIKNDTVPAMLSPGEVVLPLSVMDSKDPVKMAANFVASKLRDQKGANGDFKEALKKAIGSRKR